MPKSQTAPSTPRLSEVARHVVIPDGIVTTAWPRVVSKCAELGVTFDAWQHGIGSVALGKRDDGKYAATVGGVVLSIPRQVGKTFLVGMIVIALCLLFPGLTVLWTAHRTRTATKTFHTLNSMTKRAKVRAHMLEPRLSNGEQEIRFRNGSTVMFGAREQGFGRGFDEVDVGIFDEAQILTAKGLEDIVPATNQSRQESGALLFFMGTPPRMSDPGEEFTNRREAALSGESRDMVYVEFSADEDADPDDQAQWRKANPSFPARTPVESMKRMRANLTDAASFRHEALGIWDDLTGRAVISAARWRSLAVVGPDPLARPRALGVDMSHAGAISVVACWVDGDRAHVEEVWAGTDMPSAVQWVWEVARRRTEVLIDGMSPAAAMVPALKGRNVTVRQTTAGDMARACGLLVARANADEPSLTHADRQVALAQAVEGARKRPIGDAGGWGWDRKDPSVDIAPLVAASLALLGAETRRRSPAGANARVVVMS